MGRIGLLVPSSNTTVEPEFYRALPREVTLHTARLFLTKIAPDSILRMVEDVEAQARLLASADVDVIVLGATAPSFLKGLGYDRELIEKIENATGKPATTTSTALIQAIEQIEARRVVLVSAYDDKVNGICKAFLESSGVEVIGMKGLSIVENLEVGRLGPESSYELARAADRADADAVVLSCTNWRTMDSIERLERELGKPVISSTQATIWCALRVIGYVDSISGYGRLLREIADAPHTEPA